MFAAFRALSSIPLLDDLLALVVDTAIELTGAERGFIMRLEKDDELDFRCARNNNRQSLQGSCFVITSYSIHYTKLYERISGVCSTHQRLLSEAIKRARHIAILPFVSD